MDFEAFFEKATGNRPFPYQRRLGVDESLYQLIDVPTGTGKTAAVILAWFWRRRYAGDAVRWATPRRLVYCLPMRMLVEQTQAAAQAWLRNLGQDTDVRVHVLMGGEEAEDWDVSPERDAILIGTQDMLLSRALNRGYGMSRYRWPMHFGLLDNDCLWVLDEIQLMGSGLATSTQLQEFREKPGAWGTVQAIWMSATLRRDWLGTVDFKDKVSDLSYLGLGEEDRSVEVLGKRLRATKLLKRADVTAGDAPEDIAAFIKQEYQPGSYTLVVVNTVERAQKLYTALCASAERGAGRRRGRNRQAVDQSSMDVVQPELLLIHSRFRPPDRQDLNRKLTVADKVLRGVPLSGLGDPDQHWVDQVRKAGLIIVATQVVEAGVDISARSLITDLAPWASLVQRFGRCNRFGEHDDAQVFWIDVPTGRKSLAAPYDDQELDASRKMLDILGPRNVGLAWLEKHLEEEHLM